MKAVMYGAGNIGRGFIGALLSQAGYHVSFIDVAEPVIRALQENGRYPVRYVSTGGHEDVWVENVTAVDGRNPDAVAQAIAECDIMATAVGARVLEIIVPHIVRGLRRRWESGRAPLNILICENLMDAADVLRGMIIRLLTEQEAAIFKVIIETIFGLAGIAALVLFAHKGAVSGWVMHVGTMALAGWLGYEFGRAVRA